MHGQRPKLQTIAPHIESGVHVGKYNTATFKHVYKNTKFLTRYSLISDQNNKIIRYL